MTKDSEPFTYHGVLIPEDILFGWNDPNNSEVAGFRRGVRAALQVTGEADKQERARLEPLVQERDDEEHRAWKAQYDQDMEAYRARTEGTGNTDG